MSVFGKALCAASVALAILSATANAAVSHTVLPGETLWSIAASHYAGDPRAAVWKLEQRNGLRSTILRPGERLVLPP